MVEPLVYPALMHFTGVFSTTMAGLGGATLGGAAGAAVAVAVELALRDFERREPALWKCLAANSARVVVASGTAGATLAAAGALGAFGTLTAVGAFAGALVLTGGFVVVMVLGAGLVVSVLEEVDRQRALAAAEERAAAASARETAALRRANAELRRTVAEFVVRSFVRAPAGAPVDVDVNVKPLPPQFGVVVPEDARAVAAALGLTYRDVADAALALQRGVRGAERRMWAAAADALEAAWDPTDAELGGAPPPGSG